MKKELRRHHLRILLTDSELERFERFAAREHLNVSAAVRRAVLLAAERVAAAGLDPDPDYLSETGTD